jgi:tripartite-type tricarboxylate transporter receptor subunit TctC
MKYLFSLLLFISTTAFAATPVKIYTPYGPGHSGTPAMLRIIDEANSSQSAYKFILEFKPGGNQIIALKSMDENSLAIIAPAYVENVASGKINESDYVPIHALGDACWVGISNGSLSGRKELVVGGVGFGNATHLTALALGDKYKFSVKYVIFKSNNDALINMTGNNGVDFVIDKYEAYESMKTKNKNLTLVAASCPTRMPQVKNLKTFKEIGIVAPYVFNITVAHKDMNSVQRKAIAIILNSATAKIGQREIYNLSGMAPPLFDSISAEDFYDKSTNMVRLLQLKYKEKIAKAQDN